MKRAASGNRTQYNFLDRKVSRNGKDCATPADPFSTGEDGFEKDAGGVEG
jgi:hypothetical protein